MWRGNFVCQKSVGLVLKLIHDDSKYATACLACTATGGLHYAQITTSTDRKTSFRKQSAGTSSLAIFRILFNAFRAAKNGDYAFGGLAHFLTSAVIINDPFCL